MPEIQYHNTELQKKINKRILKLHDEYGIDLIVGMDSHYIYQEENAQRDDILAYKGIHYEDEEGWFLDYPDGNTTYQRFIEQGVFSEEQIMRAINNTNLLLDFEEYDKYIFSYEPKLPTLYPNKTQDERDDIYEKLVWQGWKEYKSTIPHNEHPIYEEEIKKEIQTVKNTKMADYFIIDYYLVRKGIEKGGNITNTGRGSGVSFITNTMLGFSKVDRIAAPVKMYPERFMSETRILKSKSMPD
jgi:DNA polymerase III alpha subunit